FYHILFYFVFFFFFSSRRRHTRFSRDWSSDVCSSDLPLPGHDPVEQPGLEPHRLGPRLVERAVGQAIYSRGQAPADGLGPVRQRSEERRVGKECRCRGEPYPEKKKQEDRTVRHHTR